MAKINAMEQGGAQRHMDQLDSLRAFAVVSVIATHAGITGHNLGNYGVTLFFTLSGFLITGILLQCRKTASETKVRRLWLLRQFYTRRFLRIFPLYYFLLITLFVCGYKPVRDGAVWYFSYLADFYESRNPSIISSGVAHFWSLAVEEQFYSVWPWLVLLTPARALRWLTSAIIGMSLVYRSTGAAMGMTKWSLWVSPFACVDALAIGSLLSIATLEGWADRFTRIALVFGIAATGALIVCHWKAPRAAIALYTIGPSLLFAWLVSCAAKGFKGLLGVVLSWRPLLWVGTISYGMYVYHLPILMLWARYEPLVSGWLTFVAVTGITILVASMSWYGFERPINNLKRFFPYRPAAASERLKIGRGDASGLAVVPAD